MMTVMQRTVAVETKKTEAGIYMRTAPGMFPWLTGSSMQVVVDLPLSSDSTDSASPHKAQPVADLSLPDYP